MPRLSKQDRDWQAQSALRTLTEAQQIQKNKPLMADVRRVARQQVSTLAKVAGRAPARKK